MLPSNYKNDYLLNQSAVYNQIRALYPSSSLQLIKPLSFFVPNRDDVPWAAFFSSNNTKFNLSVMQSANHPVYIEVVQDDASTGNYKGWCMDVFNPFFLSEFLEPYILSKVSDIYESSFWLQDNTPSIIDYSNNFPSPWNLTYRPGGALTPGKERSLPEQALHQWGPGVYADHHSLHQVYGAQFAYLVYRNLPISKVHRGRPLVISDNTAPSSGAGGIAHLLSKHNASYSDV